MAGNVEQIGRPRRARNRASVERRASILDAALRCFAQLGYDQTTMADICRRAQASTGSVYHHFQSKEQLAAALYLDGIAAIQRASLDALVGEGSAQKGVEALIGAYLAWVSKNPDHAKLLFTQRHAEFMKAAEAALAEMNREFNSVVKEWITQHVLAGDLPVLEPDMYRALLTGPAEQFCRNWLAGRTTTNIDDAREGLARAGWAGLTALA